MEFHGVNSFNFNNITNQKAGLVQNNLQENNQTQAQNQAQIQQNQTQIINPAFMYDFKTSLMDRETVLKYLQNLMKLPNSIDEFVNQLNSKNINPKIASILIENMISIKALSEFLNQNSAQAVSKLMQIISQTLKSGNSDIEQLKEMLSVLNSIQASTTTTNALKELLLLYIPLNVPVFDKNIEGKIESEEEKEAIKNSKLSILFETINFSNILIAINESQNDLYISIFAPSNFAKDEFERILSALSKEANIFALIDFKLKQGDKKGEAQNFKIISDSAISPNCLILAHLIIKIILKFDSEFI